MPAEAARLGSVLGLRIEATGEPVVLPADPQRLRQVLGNLAGNSAAAGAGAMRIQVAPHPDTVEVEVADDGPGFPAGILDTAFDRFVRGDQARTRGGASAAGGGGAGLGLAIVRGVAAAHGGSVRAANGGPLGGAVVTVELPVR